MWHLPVGVGVGILYSGQSPTRAATATGITLAASAAIRAIGWRAAASATWFGLRAVVNLSLANVGGALIGGALVGTALSYGLFGEEGAKAAVDFYTDPFDLDKAKTIAAIPSNLAEITTSNRAVAGNAAGLPTGWNSSTTPAFQEIDYWKLENFRKAFPNA